MKRILFIFAFLLCAAPLKAQSVQRAPDCIVRFTFTAVNTSAPLDNRGSGCTMWTLTYQATTGVTLAIEVDRADDNLTKPGTFFPFGPGYLGPNMALSNQISFTGFAPWLQVNLTSLSGSGTVSGILSGYRGVIPNPTLKLPCNALRTVNCQ